MAGLLIRSVVRELNPALGSLELFRHPRTPLPLTRVNRHAFFNNAALPYLWTSPLESSWLPSMMVGSAITASLSLVFHATLRAPHGGIFVIGLIGNWPLYLLAIAIGTVVSAALVIGVKEFTGGADTEKATSAAA
jgi:fructose PTS system EIIBC or EIIC component